MNTHSIEDFVLGSNKSQIYLFDSPKMFFLNTIIKSENFVNLYYYRYMHCTNFPQTRGEWCLFLKHFNF